LKVNESYKNRVEPFLDLRKLSRSDSKNQNFSCFESGNLLAGLAYNDKSSFKEWLMFKRVFLFVLTNILVLASLTLVWGLLSAFTPLGAMLGRSGYDLQSLAVFCLFWGFGGAIISLLLSRWIAKMSTGAVVIDPDRATGDDRWLLQTVYKLATHAEITTMPQVAVYPSLEINAFATGPSKNSALVAVSAGLLQKMNRDEVEGVLAHEISHVSNGDMVTLTLVQGVVNAFVMFLSYVISMIIMQALRGKDEDRRDGGNWFLRMMIHQVLQMVLSLGAYVLIIAPFSRWREFRADQGGAEKVGKTKMIDALAALKDITQAKLARSNQDQPAPALAAFKINGGVKSLFSTHPSLDERIARLRQL
jgi:heat shock protein HtpX